MNKHIDKNISAEELDKKFDAGEDILGYFDVSKARRLKDIAPRRVNVDFQPWMVEAIDREAAHLGVTRQSLIKMWLAEKLQAQEKH